ncbi:hypothetical protein BC830DRAFT_1118459 [Chytriomyces sp. MP71]|nr:hypothetical protein BC830DRAFT_1118459 [Chytriomyces sp. MP71]
MTLFSLKSEIRNEALMSVSSACRRRAIAAHNATKPKDLTGNVHFQESLQTAISSNQKPIFLQFQEMPGCQTCTSYAANVLSPPLMAEFLDTFFTPVLINNNTGYASPEDLRVLQRFDEPHYNNPTCRILSSDGITVLGHLYGVYNLRGVFAFAVSVLVNFGMGALLDRLWVDALAATCGLRLLRNARNKEVTGFVDLALETATFSMDCYWVGEAAFSQIQGVMSTKPGWLQGVEVVQATYDSSVLQYEQLAKHALSLQGFGLVLETKQQEDHH